MMNKKADVGTLALIIIVLATAAVLGGFVYKWGVQQGEESKVEACRLSILRAAQEKKIGMPGVKEAGTAFSKLECPRGELGDIYITKSDVVENDVINQDKAHRIIAEGMRECWYMAGEGKYDPFSYWSSDTDKGKSICLICKTIYFDDDLAEWMAKKQKNLIKDELGIDVSKFSNDEAGIKALNQEALKAKDKLSSQQKEEFEEKYLDYVITSPAVFLRKQNLPKTKTTYWEYLYNEEAAVLSAKEEETLRKSQVLPGSIILLRMYRQETKSWVWSAVTWIGVALVVIGLAIFVVATFGVGAIAIAVAKVAVTLALILKAALVAAVIFGIGSATVYHAGLETYTYCQDCNGIGGIVLLHPDIMPLDTETKVCLEEKCESENDLTDVKICNLLIN